MGRLAMLLITALLLTSWPAPASAAPLPQSAPCATAVAAAIAQRGKPYVWGAKGPNSFDCSGLTWWAWKQAGYEIGISTWDQAVAGVSIPCRLADLDGNNTRCWEPGDLIFARSTGGQHVAMYIGEGLFADAYNGGTGVIIHAVENDSYYQGNFWQARRIVDCDGVSVTIPPADTLPAGQTVALEDIPDVLRAVYFSVPQCGACNADGSTILPFVPWSDRFPSGWELLNPVVAVRTLFSWLAWQIGEFIRQLICWLLAIAQMFANIAAGIANVVVSGINLLWKALIFIWLTLRAWFYAFWELFEALRASLATLSLPTLDLGQLGAWFGLALDLVFAIWATVGQVISLFLTLIGIGLNVLGYVGGLVLGLLALFQAVNIEDTPIILAEDHHPFYYFVRGSADAILDSPIWWMVHLMWGLAWIAFIYWLTRFLSKEA
jgi:hypothetical protein